MSPRSATSQEAIVIRDRRKPNQFTTDNVIAREWLPILRVGDAFFFYSVYLSMANRETESSWGSLRTMARYLQCGVDLIIRGNKLLEICELIHIESGDQQTSNEYYVLDPPSLTPELARRILDRLDEIQDQEKGKNWHSWVKQVRKALSGHESLPSIWEERRNNRGGRPVKTVRAQNPDRESHAGIKQKGGSDSQAGRMCLTNRGHVSHMQGVRETHAEQEKQTTETEEIGTKRDPPLSLFVKNRCQELGISEAMLGELLASYPVEYLAQQLDWLPFRHPRDPAAMWVSAVQGGWSAPPGVEEAAGEPSAESMEDAEPKALPHDEDRTIDALVVPGGAEDAREVWSQVLEELRAQMPAASFDTWMNGAQLDAVSEGSLIVLVEDAYTADWLRTRWLTPINRILATLLGRPVPVRFEARQ